MTSVPLVGRVQVLQNEKPAERINARERWAIKATFELEEPIVTDSSGTWHVSAHAESFLSSDDRPIATSDVPAVLTPDSRLASFESTIEIRSEALSPGTYKLIVVARYVDEKKILPPIEGWAEGPVVHLYDIHIDPP